MKIFIFTQSACGGAERMSVLFAKILSGCHQVEIHSFGPTNILEPFVDKKVSFVYHPSCHATDSFIKLTRNLIRLYKPDLIFSSLMPLNWRLALSSLGLKCRIVFRSDNYLYTQSFTQKVRLALAYHKADIIIAQTEEMRQGLIRGLNLKQAKVITIQNPIDTEYIDNKLNDFSPFTGSATKFVSVGRFAYEKGFDILLKAFNETKKAIRDAKLYIVGDYNYDRKWYNTLLDLVDEIGLGKDVVFVGYTDNPYVYMKYADCFVLPSRNEGLPNVLIEALYCGTPAAAIKCIPVIERIIDEGVTGFLAEKEDFVGLSHAMINALNLGRVSSSYNSNTREMINEVFNKL